MKKSLFTLIMILACSIAHAQIETEQVEVIKEFEANLEDATKQNILPTLVVTKQERKKYKYDITILPLDIKYADPVIKPLSMKVDDPFDVASFYLKGGYGNLNNPFGKLRFAKAKDDKYEVNLYADYYSLDNTKKIQYQKMSDLNVGLNVKSRIGDNTLVSANGGLNLDKRNFFFTYIDHNLSPDGALVRNTNEYNVGVGLQNLESINEKLDYTLKGNLTLLNTSNFSANEQILGVEGQARYKLSDVFYATMPVSVNTYRYDVIDVADAQANLVASLAPQIVYHKGKINAQLGIAALTEKNGSYIWPKVDIAVGVVENYIQVLVGSDLRSTINDLKNILAFSPWANSKFDRLNVNVGKEIYGGVRGDLGYISYEGRAGYRIGTNQALFTNYRIKALETNDKPSIDYTDMNTVFFNGTVDFAVNEKLNVGGSLTKNFYDPKIVPVPLGLLSLEGNAFAKFKLLNDKLILKSDLYIADRAATDYPDASGAPTRVFGTNLADLNFGAEIWPVSNFSIYADAYNVLNNKNVRWYGYPQVGIHFNVGGIIKF